MIEYKAGDILTEDTEALVNPVNCVGVMGRGLSLQFTHAFPDHFNAYVARCKRKEMKPGHVFVFKTGEPIHPRYIINFPTKRHWRSKSRMEDVESVLSTVHWVVSKEQAQSFDDVVQRKYAWNPRKLQFSERQLKIAVDVLSGKGWIENPRISDTR